MMDVVVVFVRMRCVPCNATDNMIGHGRNGVTLWLITMLIGHIADHNVFAFGRNPAVFALDVAVLIAIATLTDLVAGVPRNSETIGTHVVLAFKHLGVHILRTTHYATIAMGHWVGRGVWHLWAGNGSQSDSENSANHQLNEQAKHE